VRIRPEALEELKAEKERILAARMSLLNEVQPDKPVPLGGGQDVEEYGQGGTDPSVENTPPSPNPYDE